MAQDTPQWDGFCLVNRKGEMKFKIRTRAGEIITLCVKPRYGKGKSNALKIIGPCEIFEPKQE